MFREMFSSSNGFEAKAGCFGKQNFYLIMCEGGLGDLLTLNCEIGIKLDGLVTLPPLPGYHPPLRQNMHFPNYQPLCTSISVAAPAIADCGTFHQSAFLHCGSPISKSSIRPKYKLGQIYVFIQLINSKVRVVICCTENAKSTSVKTNTLGNNSDMLTPLGWICSRLKGEFTSSGEVVALDQEACVGVKGERV